MKKKIFTSHKKDIWYLQKFITENEAIVAKAIADIALGRLKKIIQQITSHKLTILKKVKSNIMEKVMLTVFKTII